MTDLQTLFLTEQNRFLLTDAQSGELTGRGQCICIDVLLCEHDRI